MLGGCTKKIKNFAYMLTTTTSKKTLKINNQYIVISTWKFWLNLPSLLLGIRLEALIPILWFEIASYYYIMCPCL